MDGTTRERYVGEVEEDTREENLAAAWKLAHERGLLGQAIAKPSPRKPAPVSESSRTVMRANKSKNTKPERLLRSAVFALGLRYRIHARPVESLSRTADIVFTRVKVAVFVDGCFWHGCLEHYRPAKRNTDFWEAKIATNRQRDLDTDRELESHGWLVVRVWEHEPPAEAAARVARAVAARRSPREPTLDP